MALEPRRLCELQREAAEAGRESSFDPRTIQIVRASCARLPADQVELTREFYEQLFAMAPGTRSMFAEDMTQQHDRLLSALLAAVRALDRPEMVEDHLRRWGVVHRRMYGVTDEMYVYVGHALVRAVHRILGHVETSVASSWIVVYEWMAAVMIDGADRAEAFDRNPSALLDQAEAAPAPQAYASSGARHGHGAAESHGHDGYADEGYVDQGYPDQRYDRHGYGRVQGGSQADGASNVVPFRRSHGAA